MASSDIAVSVRGLSKAYTIAHNKNGHSTLAETILSRLKNPLSRPATETFLALKNVSFEIKKGDVVGIIGRNGAGKSTLLKVLSRITEPTAGEIDLYGRVGSLLEVGTGFHPELTGRENVFLNGAILGMTKSEIRKQFDAIVEFAGVEQFLDTPVKRYSSGMYVRLAFAVAAHLTPEILIVDEVLAVGDVTFQKKCLGKMSEVARTGRTVLFVSHNLAAVRSLCNTGIILKKGTLSFAGTAEDSVNHFLDSESPSDLSSELEFSKPVGMDPSMRSVSLLFDGEPGFSARMGSAISLVIRWRADRAIRTPRIGFVVRTTNGEAVLNANNHYQVGTDLDQPTHEGVINCDLGVVPLMAGRYVFSFWFGDESHNSHYIENALAFEILEHDAWGAGKVPPAGISYCWWPTKFQARVEQPV